MKVKTTSVVNVPTAQLNIPNLRFSEFEGEWNKLCFEDIYSFKSTNSYSRDKLNYESGDVKNIHYGDIHTKFDSLFDVSKEIVPFINQEISTAKINEDCYLKIGDLVIADASEDYDDIGKSIEVKNLNKERVVAGLHTFLARKESKKMENGFASFLMKTFNVRLEIMKIAQGIKVLSLSKFRLDKIPLFLPLSKEQVKITSFLVKINDRISTQIEIIEDYKLLKKGMMQKIFQQELRFKNEEGSFYPKWEEKKANKIFKNCTNKSHNGDLPILSASQKEGMIYRQESGIKIQSSTKSIKSYKVVEPNDFVITLRSFQGGIDFSDKKGICSPAYTILKNSIPVNYSFYKFYFKKERFINRLSKTTIGIRDGKQITYENFGNLMIPYPTLLEQQKIASTLSAIDSKITLESAYLDKLKAQKKYLLQNMFV